jgi:hypothetical protein
MFARLGKEMASAGAVKAFQTLTDGASRMVRTLTPGLISIGKIFGHIAVAALPELLKLTKDFVGWLGKIEGKTPSVA